MEAYMVIEVYDGVCGHLPGHIGGTCGCVGHIWKHRRVYAAIEAHRGIHGYWGIKVYMLKEAYRDTQTIF